MNNENRRERLIPLREVPALSFMPRPRGKRLHHSTIQRWADSRGPRRLQTLKVGSVRVTTESYLMAFFASADQAGVETAPPPAPAVPRAAGRSDATLTKELNDLGLT